MPMVCQHRHPVSHFEAASGQSAAFQPVTARGLQLPARIQIKKLQQSQNGLLQPKFLHTKHILQLHMTKSWRKHTFKQVS